MSPAIEIEQLQLDADALVQRVAVGDRVQAEHGDRAGVNDRAVAVAAGYERGLLGRR